MNCKKARTLLMAYLDSELDARSTTEVGEHLDDCPGCAQRFEAEDRLERVLLARLDGADADAGMPEDVWTRARANVRGSRLPWWRWAAAAATVFFAVGMSIYLQPQADGMLLDLMRSHRETIGGTQPLSIKDPEPGVLERFVADVLEHEGDDLPFRLPTSEHVGGHPIAVVGARPVTVLGQPAANVLLRCCGLPMSVVVMRRERLDALPTEAQGAPGRGEVAVDELRAQAFVTDDLVYGFVWSQEHAPPLEQLLAIN